MCDGTQFAKQHHFIITWGFTNLPEHVPEPELVQLARDDTLNRVTATVNGCEARVLKVTNMVERGRRLFVAVISRIKPF